jgi:iron complex outermembrane receptor protein
MTNGKWVGLIPQAAVSVLLCLVSYPAIAQTDVAVGGIEKVIVTAEKQEADVQTVPLTVTPISGATIERLHIESLSALDGSVPNLQVTVNSGVSLAAGVVIRGIGEVNNPTAYAGKEVAIVVDGVEQSTNQFGLTNQFDVERIEVLAGPQGTLFGANTTGGVINIVTRQPTGEFGVSGIASMGNYNTRNAQVAVDFPIIDDVLSGKVSVSHVGRDGFYTNLYNGQNLGALDSNTYRGYLRWTPVSNLDITLKSEVQSVNIENTYLQNLSTPGAVFYRPDTALNFTIYDNIPGGNILRSQSHTLTTNWNSSVGEVTAITNYQRYHSTGNLDVGGIDCYCLDQFGRNEGWQASQEIRDVFHPLPSINMLVGVFAQTWQDKGNGVSVVPFASPNLVTVGLTNQRNWSASLFTQNYWNVTDRLRLQAGLRLSWDSVSLSEAALSYDQPNGTNVLLLRRNLVGATLLPYAPGNPPNSGTKSWTNWGGKFGADYQVTDEMMVYGFYARGFKSGGFNGRVTRAEDIGPFNPENVNSFEAGVKSQWLDNRLQFNASLFLNKWTNMQVQQSDYNGPTIASVILNAGKATTEGVEIQAQAAPFDGFLLVGNLGYLQSRYDQFFSTTNPPCPPLPLLQPPGCAISYAGRALPYAPNWTAAITGTYDFDVAGGDASVQLQYTYTSGKWGNYTQAPTERLPSVGLINANISWGPRDSHWSIALWGRNLADKTYVATALDVPPLFTEGTLGNPRTWGADLKFNF